MGREGEREGEKHLICGRSINQLTLTCPQLGTWLTTLECAPTGNLTYDLSVRKMALNLLSHTSQGPS